MTTIDEMGETSHAAPLGDLLLARDVSDVLRRDPELAQPPDAVGRLRTLYTGLGIAAPDAALADGMAAHETGRFNYVPPSRGFGAALARLYVARRSWLPGTAAIVVLLLAFLAGYVFVYRPYRDAQIEAAHLELTTTMPAEMDALYQTIFDETKVQQAATDASAIRDRGKAAVQQGDRAGAAQAIADLTTIRDTLRLDYRLTIVGGAAAKWGFWSFPEDNSDETNYFLVVEARNDDGTVLNVPVHDSASGRTDTVTAWGLRVPEDVYRSVEADKNDDGVIEHNVVGIKQFGFLEPDYMVDVLGGAVTHW